MNVHFSKVQKNNCKKQMFGDYLPIFPRGNHCQQLCSSRPFPCALKYNIHVCSCKASLYLNHYTCCAPCAHAHIHTLMYTNRLQYTCCLSCICAHMHTLVCLKVLSLWCFLRTSFLCNTRVQVNVFLLTSVPAISCPLLRPPGFFHNCGVHSWCFEQLITLSWLICR